MEFLNPYIIADIPLLELLRNLALGIIIATVWSFVISKTTRLIVDLRQYLPIFLLLVISMILIITTIKTSIALSLGLVGALSIVRFRTPIKEPEELLYIFVAIAMGLGLGANQVLSTLLGFLVIVFSMLPFAFFRKSSLSTQSSFIDLILYPKQNNQINVKNIEDIIKNLKFKYKIRRISETLQQTEILFEASKVNLEEFEQFKHKLRDYCENYEISITSNARIIT